MENSLFRDEREGVIREKGGGGWGGYLHRLLLVLS